MEARVTSVGHDRVRVSVPLGSTRRRRERVLELQVTAGEGANRDLRYVQVWLKSVGPRGGGRYDPGVLVGSAEIDMREDVVVPGVFGGVSS